MERQGLPVPTAGPQSPLNHTAIFVEHADIPRIILSGPQALSETPYDAVF